MEIETDISFHHLSSFFAFQTNSIMIISKVAALL